jgi:hypothetical protein
VQLKNTTERTLIYTNDEIATVVKADAIRRGLMPPDCEVYIEGDTDKVTATLMCHTKEDKEVPAESPTRIEVGRQNQAE